MGFEVTARKLPWVENARRGPVGRQGPPVASPVPRPRAGRSSSASGAVEEGVVGGQQLHQRRDPRAGCGRTAARSRRAWPAHGRARARGSARSVLTLHVARLQRTGPRSARRTARDRGSRHQARAPGPAQVGAQLTPATARALSSRPARSRAADRTGGRPGHARPADGPRRGSSGLGCPSARNRKRGETRMACRAWAMPLSKRPVCCSVAPPARQPLQGGSLHRPAEGALGHPLQDVAGVGRRAVGGRRGRAPEEQARCAPRGYSRRMPAPSGPRTAISSRVDVDGPGPSAAAIAHVHRDADPVLARVEPDRQLVAVGPVAGRVAPAEQRAVIDEQPDAHPAGERRKLLMPSRTSTRCDRRGPTRKRPSLTASPGPGSSTTAGPTGPGGSAGPPPGCHHPPHDLLGGDEVLLHQRRRDGEHVADGVEAVAAVIGRKVLGRIGSDPEEVARSLWLYSSRLSRRMVTLPGSGARQSTPCTSRWIQAQQRRPLGWRWGEASGAAASDRCARSPRPASTAGDPRAAPPGTRRPGHRARPPRGRCPRRGSRSNT